MKLISCAAVGYEIVSLNTSFLNREYFSTLKSKILDGFNQLINCISKWPKESTNYSKTTLQNTSKNVERKNELKVERSNVSEAWSRPLTSLLKFNSNNEETLQSPKYTAHRKFHRRKTAEVGLLLATLTLSLISVVHCLPNSSSCFTCTEVHRESIGPCASEMNECGHCLTGFFDSEGQCVQLEVVISPPEVVEGVEGSEVELGCVLSVRVRCEWTRNGELVDVDGFRYSYRSPEAETEDCTLVIKGVNAIDLGDWQCRIKGLTTRKETTTKLSLQKKPEVVVHPEASVSALYGDQVLLACQFDEPVECSWMSAPDENADYNSVAILDNYEYVERSRGAKKDCSLRIKSVGKEEEGVWRCSGRHQRTKVIVQSQTTTITGCDLGLIPMSNSHIYVNHTAVDGKLISIDQYRSIDDNDQLICVAERKAKSIRWKMNGSVIKAETEVQSVSLNGNEIEAVKYNDVTWPNIKLECEIENGNDKQTLYVSIPNTEKYHTNVMILRLIDVLRSSKLSSIEIWSMEGAKVIYVLVLAIGLMITVVRLHFKSNRYDYSVEKQRVYSQPKDHKIEQFDSLSAIMA